MTNRVGPCTAHLNENNNIAILNTSEEEFIRDCCSLLQRGISPNQVLSNEYSLIEKVFQYLGERRFDDSLNLLLPLIEELTRKSADFKKRVTEIEYGIPCIDLTCQQIAFIYWKQLAKENHVDSPIAQHIFELVGNNMDDIYDCLFVGHLERVTFLLRSTRPNPNQIVYGQSIMQKVFQELAAGFYEEELQTVPDLILALLECRGNPNLQFPSISIKGKGKYQNPTCLHIAYLYWQALKAMRKSNEAKLMKEAFLLLLKDPRIDVTLRFTEISLDDRDGGHFSNDYLEGDYLEEGNLAHYALVDGDFGTVRKVVSLARNLIGSTCFTVTRKWLLDEAQNCYMASLIDPRNKQEMFFLPHYPSYRSTLNTLKNSSLTGTLANLYWEEKLEKLNRSTVIRYGRVSLTHIAARRLDREACVNLTNWGDNEGIPDTERRSVIDYARLHQEDDLIYNQREKTQKEKTAKAVFKALKQAQPLPPILPQAFYTFYQDGYQAMYHPGTKCAIVHEVLHEDMLKEKVSNNKHKGYRQHPSIPKMNRGSVQDFKAQGVVCGHAKPRADSLASDQALYDAGYLINILAQNQVLNNGLWKRVEKLIRDLTQTHLCLDVYTGGVFTSPIDMKGPKIVSYHVLGQGEVSMPTHLFKVVYIFDYGTGWKAFACLIPNMPLTYHTSLQQYFVPVERIQELSGCDFIGKHGMVNYFNPPGF